MTFNYKECNLSEFEQRVNNIIKEYKDRNICNYIPRSLIVAKLDIGQVQLLTRQLLNKDRIDGINTLSLILMTLLCLKVLFVVVMIINFILKEKAKYLGLSDWLSFEKCFKTRSFVCY